MQHPETTLSHDEDRLIEIHRDIPEIEEINHVGEVIGLAEEWGHDYAAAVLDLHRTAIDKEHDLLKAMKAKLGETPSLPAAAYVMRRRDQLDRDLATILEWHKALCRWSIDQSLA